MERQIDYQKIVKKGLAAGVFALGLTAVLAGDASAQGKETVLRRYPECRANDLNTYFVTHILNEKGEAVYYSVNLGPHVDQCGNRNLAHIRDKFLSVSLESYNASGGFVRANPKSALRCFDEAEGFALHADPSDGGFGYADVSGGLNPQFPKDLDPSVYINVNLPEGTHQRSYMLKCMDRFGYWVSTKRATVNINFIKLSQNPAFMATLVGRGPSNVQ